MILRRKWQGVFIGLKNVEGVAVIAHIEWVVYKDGHGC
jgi:hypothetical protein